MTGGQDERRRRTIGLILVAGVVLLFLVQIAALVSGNAVLAGVTAALFLVAWFVLRSWQRRRAPG